MSGPADAIPALRLRARRPSLRLVAIAVALVWLGAGLAGGWLYVHRYEIYRGFPPPVRPAGVSVGHPVRIAFHSAALGRRETILVYLPPGYRRMAAAGRRFPALYILHGHPGLAANILEAGAAGRDLDTLIAAHRVRPMLLVLPEITAGPGHGDTEWANTRIGRYDSVVADVVHAVDQRFPTLRNRHGRILAGLSEGAYAAVNAGLHHLPLFGGIQSWSGYFVQQPNGVFTGATPATIAANSPIDYVPRLAPEIRRLGLRAYLYEGYSEIRRHTELVPFTAELRAAGAQATWARFPGGHDWELWRREMPRMLILANRWFRHPVRGRASRHAAAGLAGRAAALYQRAQIDAARQTLRAQAARRRRRAARESR
jgi:enterochelin esterase-like enzyme